MIAQLSSYFSVAEAFAKILHPLAEVIVHDLKKNKIIKIINSFSNRKVGDESYLDINNFTKKNAENVIGPYEKINHDGRKLKSISLIIRDYQQKSIGLLCVNMDVTIFDNHHQLLKNFLFAGELNERSHSLLFKNDAHEKIKLFINEYCNKHNLSIHSLRRKDKAIIVIKLQKAGAFSSKNSLAIIGNILNISRATIYNYLKEE